MGRNEDLTTRYQLSEAVDITAAFSAFDIEYLPVTETRVITIYRQTIINIELTDGTLEAARILNISVIDSSSQEMEDLIKPPVESLLDQICTAADVAFHQVY